MFQKLCCPLVQKYTLSGRGWYQDCYSAGGGEWGSDSGQDGATKAAATWDLLRFSIAGILQAPSLSCKSVILLWSILMSSKSSWPLHFISVYRDVFLLMIQLLLGILRHNLLGILLFGLCHQNVGKYLKRSAQALEHQVEREAVFYGALMRYLL